MEKLVMPEREASDGQIAVTRDGARIEVTVVNAGKQEMIDCSEYNAWRILGALSIILGVPLSKAAQRAVKL
jgi:hypothetical protein